MVMNVVRLIDEYFFDIGPSMAAEQRANAAQDPEGRDEARIRLVNAHTYLCSLVFNTLRSVSQFAAVFFEKFSSTWFYQFFQDSRFIISCSILGFLTNGLTTLYEGFGIACQSAFIYLFHSRAWQGSPAQIADDLQTLINQPDTKLENRLRPWFVQRNIDREQITAMIADIRSGNAAQIQAGKNLLAAVRCQAFKKLCVHIVGLLSAVLGILSLIATFVFPPSVPAALFFCGMGLFVIRYFLSSGWMDNPGQGFSLLNCLPEFIRKHVCCNHPSDIPLNPQTAAS